MLEAQQAALSASAAASASASVSSLPDGGVPRAVAIVAAAAAGEGVEEEDEEEDDASVELEKFDPQEHDDVRFLVSCAVSG